MVQFDILGTLRVTTDSGPSDVRGRLRRSLLLRLLISANQVVPAEKLADDLWAGQPPRGVASTLRSHASLLRQAVGPQRILGREGGYQLIVGDDELDAVNFVSEVEAGRRALIGGDPSGAVQLLTKGLERWRGTPLADVSDADWSRSERTRLGDLHDQAYQELRGLLREELGIEPSPELVMLESAILLQDPELDWVPSSTSTPYKPEGGLDQSKVSGVVGLPKRLSLVPVTGMVARDAELAQVTDAFNRVAAGEGREVVLVSGEPGIGKTTLVAESARKAFASGACVLLGHCDEDLRVPYAPFAEALGHYIDHGPAGVRQAYAEAHGGELVRDAPTLATRLGSFHSLLSTDPDTERYLLYGSVVRLLALASSLQPLVLVLEDLQWSDDASLRLLRHLVTTAGLDRVLVLVTFRETALIVSEPLTELLGAFRRELGMTRVELERFDSSGVLALMEATIGQSLEGGGATLAHVVFRETEGNPFFAVEVLQSLLEAGPSIKTMTTSGSQNRIFRERCCRPAFGKSSAPVSLDSAMKPSPSCPSRLSSVPISISPS
jgi:DNA-binding SARP family transcriptional activator